MSGEQRIRVMIVDDHAMVRKGMAMFLKTAPELELVAEVASGEAAVDKCAQVQPDVVLMDLNMPGMGGIEATRTIRQRYPDTQVVVITSFGEEELVQGAIQAGAISYLFKDVSSEHLAEAIRAAYEGERRLAPKAMEALIGALSCPPARGHDLTPREREVLALMVRGLNNTQIAEALYVGRSTVKTHVSSILSKLEVASRVEAVALAIQEKLVDDSGDDPLC